jgi:hypothetical protein
MVGWTERKFNLVACRKYLYFQLSLNRARLNRPDPFKTELT